MEISGSFTVEAPQDVVWRSLLDTEVLVSVLPGCDCLEEVSPKEYEGVLNTKVGPVQGIFDCKIKLEDIDEPNSYSMQIQGQGPAGVIRATARVQLESEGDFTKLSYASDAKVGGRVASVGQRLLDASAKAITKQSLIAFNEVVKARLAVEETGAEQDFEPPSGPTQAEFAAGVAKEVARDLIPPPVRIGLVVGAILLITALAYWIL